ncbi:MAG: IPT/TIG domain-containing protein [Planctomycetota bacterium]
MTRAHRFVRGIAAFSLGTVAVAQTFDYPSFANTTGLTLNGSALQSGNNLRLTNNAASQTGSAWYTTPLPVAQGFETTFDFVMSSAPEGLAFVIQGAQTGATTIGGGSWGIGYGFGSNTQPIPNSIAIEMDATQDIWTSDTSANELSIHTVGALGNSENEGVSIGRVTPAIDMSNGTQRKLRVRYVPGVGQPGTLTVFLDNLVTPVLTTPFSFETGGTQLSGGNTGGLGLINGQAWVGFTSSTRSGMTNQFAEIRSWSWTSFQLPNACYTGNVHVGSGGPYDLLTINGNAGGFFRLAQLAVADPFTLGVATPPGVSSAPFVLCLTVGIADGATVTPTPFGNACFPLLLPIDIGSSTAPYTLAVPPGIPLTLPLTFQAVMASQPLNPSVIELTNAIGAQFNLAPAPTISGVTPNSAAVGGTITVNGNNFSLFATVRAGNIPVTPITLTKTQVTFAMPAGVPCGSQVRVTNPDGAQATFAFNPTPVVTTTPFNSGPVAGGQTWLATGTGFAPGTTVTFNGNPANVSSASATVVLCTTPPGVAGPATVVITTPGGCSVTRPYTYQ